MSATSPPDPNVNLFNNLYWQTADEFITLDYANKHYLKYPIAQGKETLQAIDVNGLATFKNIVTFEDGIHNTTLDQNGNNFIIDNNGAAGSIVFSQSKAGGLERTVMTLTAETGCVINKQSDETPNATALKINDTISSRHIGCFINSQGDSLYNPLVRTFDNVIFSARTSPNTESLTLTINATTATGVRITPTSSLIGFGSSTTTPTSSFLCDASGCTIRGITNFSSTTPPTSSQTIPLATDSSTNIPTTAWVQSAIDAKTSISDTNTDATFFPIFASSTGNQSFRADATTTPWTINPNLGLFQFGNSIKIGTSLRTAFGENAGLTNQGTAATAIGRNAAQTNQGTQATAVGQLAGSNFQAQFAVAIGSAAGAGQSITNFQGDSAIAVGHEAGRNFQQTTAIAIGKGAAIGNPANAATGQRTNAVAIGTSAGAQSQQEGSIAIGNLSGNTSQSTFAVAIGQFSGQTSQGSECVAIGSNAGNGTQATQSIAIGAQSGASGQGLQSVAIGYQAGFLNQHANSIILNASGAQQNSDGTSRFYVNPIRNARTTNVLSYNNTSKEVSFYELDMYYGEFISTFSSWTFGANTPEEILTLGTTNTDNYGVTYTGATGVFRFNKVGVFKVGISILLEESGGSGADFYFCWVDAAGLIVNSGSVTRISGNNEKTLAYAEIIYNSTSTNATIKPRFMSTTSTVSTKAYAAPHPNMAANPALIVTIYQINN